MKDKPIILVVDDNPINLRVLKLAKNGFIQNFCRPNALLTFNEYLQDYASDATRDVGHKLIQKEVEQGSGACRKSLEDRLSRIEKGERDLYL